MPYSCNTWIGVFPGLAVIILPKLQKTEKGVLCMPKREGRQKHTEASFDRHQRWRGRRRRSPAASARAGEARQSPGPAAAGPGQGRAGAGRGSEDCREITWIPAGSIRRGPERGPERTVELQPLQTKPTNSFRGWRPRATSAHPAHRPRPQEGRGQAADPGPRTAERAGPSARRSACSRGGDGAGKGLYPECSWEAGSPAPASPAHRSRPCRLGLHRPGADLKVPLSSRSSGGAAARCLLWDMARRDGSAAGGRAVRSDVLAPRVGRSPSGELQRRHRRRLPSFHSPSPLSLRPSCEGDGRGRRRSLGVAAPARLPATPPRGPGSVPFSRPSPAHPLLVPSAPAPPTPSRSCPSKPGLSGGPARAPPSAPGFWAASSARPPFCVFIRRLFPARRGLSGRQASQSL